MKVLAILRPTPGVDVGAALAEHGRSELRAVWQDYCEGSLREIYSLDGPGAVLILESESPEAASALLARLPLVETGAMSVELIALHPFTPLGTLFK